MYPHDEQQILQIILSGPWAHPTSHEEQLILSGNKVIATHLWSVGNLLVVL